MTEQPEMLIAIGVLDAMNEFLARMPRAKRLSRVKPPRWLKLARNEYSEHIFSGKREAALEALCGFIYEAVTYRKKAAITSKFDERLRKPIARLQRLDAESQKWVTMNRLRSPRPEPKRLSFVSPTTGMTVKIFGGPSPYDASHWFNKA